MKVVFLDFDGVLNSVAWIKGGRRGEREMPDKVLDPAAVLRVNTLCERTGAVVVISSTWRLFKEDCVALLCRRGFTGTVVGKTPDHSWQPGDASNLWASRSRGSEIQAWLDAHPGVEAFVILDDDADMAHLMDKLVQTDFERGLTDAHVERAVAMLGEIIAVDSS